jgi:hypothetical protein
VITFQLRLEPEAVKLPKTGIIQDREDKIKWARNVTETETET